MMALSEELEAAGGRLFRWRSYLPLALLPAVAAALWGYRRPLGSLAAHEAWAAACLAVAAAGLAVRVTTVGFVPPRTSGRNVRVQRADALNTTGMYSVVRHPLYLGNFLVGLGLAAFLADGWLVAVYMLAFWLYYERIMYAEEAFLRRTYGGEFEAWAAETPAFVPRLAGWRPPSRPFSARFALRREASTLLTIAVPFVLFEEAERLRVDGRLSADPVGAVWLAFGATVAVTYLTLRAIKTRTSILSPVAGGDTGGAADRDLA